jgi:hypothetical protein
VRRLVDLLGPFARALDARLAPQSPERMAELLAKNLPRYKPFALEGLVVQGQGRTPAARSLQWSGVA